MARYILFLIIGIVFISCEEKQQISTPQTETIQFKKPFKGIDHFLTYKNRIDSTISIKQLPSLQFTHKTGNIIQSTAFFNEQNELVKAELEKTGKNGNQVFYTYYFLKEVLSMVVKTNIFVKNNNSNLKEHIVFFNANQAPIALYRRNLKSIDDDQKTPFIKTLIKNKMIREIDVNLNLFSQMQNQEDQFALYFQEFDEALDKPYIQLGNNYYSTNLVYDENNTIIKEILKNQKKNLSQKFKIEYQFAQDPNGLQYQYLTNIEYN